jgi:hypothetical protein
MLLAVLLSLNEEVPITLEIVHFTMKKLLLSQSPHQKKFTNVLGVERVVMPLDL